MNRWVLLGGLALALRVLAAWWLGPGPLGPDGPGAEAAAVLGGHPYPLHPALIGLFGARPLSLVAGTLTVLGCAALGLRWGDRFWGPGLAAAAAPLLVYTSALAGGDALAMALATVGLALAASGRGLVGGFLAAASVWAKPITLPLLPLLLVTPSAGLSLVSAGATLAVGHEVLAPLLAPRAGGGLLGSWWASSGGLPPSVGQIRDLVLHAVGVLWDLPLWCGHPVIGGLAAVGVVLGGAGRGRRALALVVAMGATLAAATLLGDLLRPRYLGAASVPLTVLAGIALGRIAPAALVLALPTAALVSQVGALRATEEDLPLRPVLGWPPVAAEAEFRDIGVCGATTLRTLAEELAEELPRGSEVVVLRLRDGRQNDLLWPLQAARPDLRTTVFHAGCCLGAAPGVCAAALRFHLDLGGTLVAPLADTPCQTEQVDPGEAALLPALVPLLEPQGTRYGIRRAEGKGRKVGACEGVGGRPPR